MKIDRIKYFSYFILVSNLPVYTFCQELIKIDPKNTCLFEGCDESINSELFTFTPSNRANAIISDILAKVGLEPNFKVLASDVNNASAAFFNDGTKVIFYNEDFVRDIDLAAKNNWASVFILAHEIGHHLNAHKLDDFNKKSEMELDADKFAGFVLYKLGANLTETLSALNNTKSTSGCDTHPPRTVRLQAATVGWTKAKEEEEGKLDCEIKNTGAYCFINKTTKDVYVFLCDKESFVYQNYGCIGYGANIGGSNKNLTIRPNEKKCFSQYIAKSWGYTIQAVFVDENLPSYDQNRKKITTIESGELTIERCGSNTREIK